MRLRVGVLMGGKSTEREVSFNSGRTICDHLDVMRYEVIPIFQTSQGQLYLLPWRFLHRGKTTDFIHRLPLHAQALMWDDLKHLVDFVYIAMHGRFAEDGTVQGFLEVLRIPYLGSKVMASSLGMDKFFQKDIMRQQGIVVPDDVRVKPAQVREFGSCQQEILDELAGKNIAFPVVVKPRKEGSSLGVSVVMNHNELHQALINACYIQPAIEQDVLIEPRIEGMEFSCIVLTDYKTNTPLPLPPTEIVHEPGTYFYDYDQKYMPGRSIKFTPARCEQTIITRIEQAAIAVAQCLDIITIARIEGFVTLQGNVVIIESNTLAGMAPSSFLFKQAAERGMSHTQLINHLIETEIWARPDKVKAFMAHKEQTMQQAQDKRIRVAVLMGGRSHEKEISLESGRNVTYKLSPQKYKALPLFVTDTLELFAMNEKMLVCNSTREVSQALEGAQKVLWSDVPKLADFVFIALHGGEGENGAIQGTLEMLGVPYNGSSVLTSALCMDKYRTAQFLSGKGFNVPRQFLISKKDWSIDQKSALAPFDRLGSFPLIVKPHDDGCSVMVYKVANEHELIDACARIFTDGKEYVLVEELIQGMELTVGVLGNDTVQVLPASQAIVTAGILSIEEKFLPGQGENQTPAPLDAQAFMLVEQTMTEAYKALDCKGYARIDCFYQEPHVSPTGKSRVVILELNTLPGLTPATCIFHQAAEIGLQPMEFIDRIITLGFEQHEPLQSASLAEVTFPIAP